MTVGPEGAAEPQQKRIVCLHRLLTVVRRRIPVIGIGVAPNVRGVVQQDSPANQDVHESRPAGRMYKGRAKDVPAKASTR
jgi:hypothetical protein